MWTRGAEYVRIVAAGVVWFPPKVKRREFMYVCIYVKLRQEFTGGLHTNTWLDNRRHDKKLEDHFYNNTICSSQVADDGLQQSVEEELSPPPCPRPMHESTSYQDISVPVYATVKGVSTWWSYELVFECQLLHEQATCVSWQIAMKKNDFLKHA